jgi:hypothetical protein
VHLWTTEILCTSVRQASGRCQYDLTSQISRRLRVTQWYLRSSSTTTSRRPKTLKTTSVITAHVHPQSVLPTKFLPDICNRARHNTHLRNPPHAFMFSGPHVRRHSRCAMHEPTRLTQSQISSIDGWTRGRYPARDMARTLRYLVRVRDGVGCIMDWDRMSRGMRVVGGFTFSCASRSFLCPYDRIRICEHAAMISSRGARRTTRQIDHCQLLNTYSFPPKRVRIQHFTYFLPHSPIASAV